MVLSITLEEILTLKIVEYYQYNVIHARQIGRCRSHSTPYRKHVGHYSAMLWLNEYGNIRIVDEQGNGADGKRQVQQDSIRARS